MRDIFRIFFLITAAMTTFMTQANATPYAFCREADHTAWSDEGYTQRATQFDRVCQLPIASAVPGAQQRCQATDDFFCQGGADPDGSHDVPSVHRGDNPIWYKAPGIGTIPAIRCYCGCVPRDSQVLTNIGWAPIDKLAAYSNNAILKVALPGVKSGSFSKKLAPRDFVVGPETRAMVRIRTTDGKHLLMTDKHPVVVAVQNKQTMVQAKELKVGDTVYTTSGDQVEIATIESAILPANDNMVFNLNTGRGGKGGIIAINDLRTGDLRWQTALSEREERMKAMLIK